MALCLPYVALYCTPPSLGYRVVAQIMADEDQNVIINPVSHLPSYGTAWQPVRQLRPLTYTKMTLTICPIEYMYANINNIYIHVHWPETPRTEKAQ